MKFAFLLLLSGRSCRLSVLLMDFNPDAFICSLLQ